LVKLFFAPSLPPAKQTEQQETNTSGAGGLYPSDACGLIVLYNKA
jgi:hypothetical protein